jgi:nucleotide-binding universal stress UspA family protein
MPDKPLLICYDGSGEADRAIDAAATLLTLHRAIILDVGPPLTEAESVAALSPVMPGGTFEELNLDDAPRRARAGADRARDAGFAAEAHAGVAAPTWEAIVEVANEIEAALIVLGSRGLNSIRDVFEGSVSHAVAEHARRPVLIVPPPRATHAHAVGPVLICYDGSPGAQQAISAAGSLLVDRHAVVLDVGPLDLVAETYAAAGSGAADVSAAVFEGTLAQAEAGAGLARQAGFHAEARAAVDAPTWRGIVKVADEIDAPAIVVGSHGLSGLRELIEGSVSHDVAEHAGRPVLVVPARQRH